VVINSANNLRELPEGFFNVVTASGKKSLGYNSPPMEMMLPDIHGVIRKALVDAGGFRTFDCGETVVVRGKRVTLDKKRDELPTVKLEYKSDNTGRRFIETDADDYEPVSWGGEPPSSGVQWR
jgi:hypothetical protein